MVEIRQVWDRVEGIGIRKVAGKHSLTVGELIGLAVLLLGVYQYMRGKGKKWLYVGVGATAITQILF